MEISFVEISEDNFDDCIDLKVREDQRHFVASNVFSIAQSKIYPEAQPRCIYADGVLVGFAMYGIDSDDNNLWISRYMIDERYQGKGLGKAALTKLLELLSSEYGPMDIYLSTEPENLVAQGLYKSLGFEATGQVLEGEEVFCRPVTKK